MLEFDRMQSHAQLTYEELFYRGFMESKNREFVSMALFKDRINPVMREAILREMVKEYGSMEMVYEIRDYHEKYPGLNQEQLLERLIKESEYKYL